MAWGAEDFCIAQFVATVSSFVVDFQLSRSCTSRHQNYSSYCAVVMAAGYSLTEKSNLVPIPSGETDRSHGCHGTGFARFGRG